MEKMFVIIHVFHIDFWLLISELISRKFHYIRFSHNVELYFIINHKNECVGDYVEFDIFLMKI